MFSFWCDSLQLLYNIVLFPQDNSKWRHHYLSSLYDYMQGCNKELAYLGDEQTKTLKQDWSDHMLDPPDVRRQYEVRVHLRGQIECHSMSIRLNITIKYENVA